MLVRPVSTTKVSTVNISAMPTASGATHFRRIPPVDSASDGSNGGAEVSAVVIPAIGDLKGFGSACRGLMHSYHNVARMRQFRGAPRRESDRCPVFDQDRGGPPELPLSAA